MVLLRLSVKQLRCIAASKSNLSNRINKPRQMYLSGLLIVYSGAIIKQLTIISPLRVHALPASSFLFENYSSFLVSFFIHLYRFTLIPAAPHLKTWSALRQAMTATGGHLKTKAARKETGRTMPQMLMRSLMRTNFASPPPRMIPVATGIW